eukprot:1162125-Pelagomonas_calceolata.AAC.11
MKVKLSTHTHTYIHTRAHAHAHDARTHTRSQPHLHAHAQVDEESEQWAHKRQRTGRSPGPAAGRLGPGDHRSGAGASPAGTSPASAAAFYVCSPMHPCGLNARCLGVGASLAGANDFDLHFCSHSTYFCHLTFMDAIPFTAPVGLCDHTT